jgi:hypothetical protein
MTALTRYARLEAPGLWRETPGGQRREVVIALGDATLVLSDGRTDRPLAHWSLAAVCRMNPGATPAVFAPGPEGGVETLEIEDATMIEAIETVRRAIAARRPRPGRLRSGATLAFALLAAALALFWLPGALVGHAARVLPASKQAEIGRLALADLEPLTGAPCASAAGSRALDRLAERLLGPGAGRLVVLRRGIAGTAHLPGGLVLVDRRLIEADAPPDVVAGHILAETLRAEEDDALGRLLAAAGVMATARLLATGDLPAGAIAGRTAAILDRPPPALPDEAVIARFAAAQVATTPWALARDPTGESVLTLIEADPLRDRPGRPVIADDDWIRLQAICG